MPKPRLRRASIARSQNQIGAAIAIAAIVGAIAVIAAWFHLSVPLQIPGVVTPSQGLPSPSAPSRTMNSRFAD